MTDEIPGAAFPAVPISTPGIRARATVSPATPNADCDDDLAEARAELRAVARDLLTAAAAATAATPATPAGWRQLAQAGWLGLEIPTALGGADATFAETAVILEELGRAAAPGPYLGAIALGVAALRELTPTTDRDNLLNHTAAGAALPVAVLATENQDDGWFCTSRCTKPSIIPRTPPFRLERASGGLRLHGCAAFVPDAADATRLLLLAVAPGDSPATGDAPAPQDTDLRRGDGPGNSALVIVDCNPNTVGLTITPQPVVDATRRLARVTADNVQVDGASVWRFDGDPSAAVGRLLDRAAVAIACDSLGLSEAMLDATVAYAKVRHQFGRPIGSFQAVKHACADMLVQITVARGLVDAAVRALANGDPQATVAASMAKAHACETAVQVAGKAMQLHGGIGYTWESGVHAYLKRAALNRSLFGAPADHRRRLAARYQEGPVGP